MARCTIFQVGREVAIGAGPQWRDLPLAHAVNVDAPSILSDER